MKYQFILFDADNTLFDFNQCEREALQMALHSVGVTVTDGMIETYSAINDGMWKMLERGEITKSRLRTKRFEDFAAHYGLAVDVASLSTAYTDSLAKQAFLVDGAVEVCRELSRRYRLFLVTNGIATVQRGRLSASPLLPFFEQVFISEELGAEKPSRIFFDKVAAAVPDFSFERALIVGDSLSADIKGGIAVGMDTCWYNPQGKGAPADLPITFTIGRLEELLSPAML